MNFFGKYSDRAILVGTGSNVAFAMYRFVQSISEVFPHSVLAKIWICLGLYSIIKMISRWPELKAAMTIGWIAIGILCEITTSRTFEEWQKLFEKRMGVVGAALLYRKKWGSIYILVGRSLRMRSRILNIRTACGRSLAVVRCWRGTPVGIPLNSLSPRSISK